MLEKIIRITKLPINDIRAAFLYGSRIYGTSDDSSDFDIAVVSNSGHSGTEIRQGEFNIHLYDVDTFSRNLRDHKVVPIECVFSPHIILPGDFSFVLNISTLRHEFSAKASNSWVKAKKKLMVENDFYIGKKSLFHSFRILMFGIQLANFGKIINFSEANHIYHEIMNDYETSWDHYDQKYRNQHNELFSKFREVAPK